MGSPIQPEAARLELLEKPPVVGVGDGHQPVGGLAGHIQPGGSPILHPPIPIGQIDLHPIQLGENLSLTGSGSADDLLELDELGFEPIYPVIPLPVHIVHLFDSMPKDWDRNNPLDHQTPKNF
jgi:hypothetical protein